MFEHDGKSNLIHLDGPLLGVAYDINREILELGHERLRVKLCPIIEHLHVLYQLINTLIFQGGAFFIVLESDLEYHLNFPTEIFGIGNDCQAIQFILLIPSWKKLTSVLLEGLGHKFINYSYFVAFYVKILKGVAWDHRLKQFLERLLGDWNLKLNEVNEKFETIWSYVAFVRPLFFYYLIRERC